MNATPVTPCDTCNGLGAIRPDSAYFSPCHPRHPSAEVCHGCDGTCVDHTDAAAQLAHDIATHPDTDDSDRAVSGAEAYALYSVAENYPGEVARTAFVDAWEAAQVNAERVAVRRAS